MRLERNKWDTDKMVAAISSKYGAAVIVPSDFTYKTVDTLETFICPTHGEFKKSCYGLLRSKYPCHWCCPNHKKSWEEIEQVCEFVHGKRYDYSLCKNNYRPKYKMEIICKEHGMFKQSMSEHLRGSGCKQCYLKKNNLTVNKFLYESIKYHGDKYDYSMCFSDFLNSKSLVTIVCKKHGEFKQRANDHKNGSGCPLCKNSKGESAIANSLIRRGVSFIAQKTFDDCVSDKGKPYRFDFYLTEYNLLIEFDGAQHYQDASEFFDIAAIKQSDIVKTKYANDTNIRLIRISDITKIDSIVDMIMDGLKRI